MPKPNRERWADNELTPLNQQSSPTISQSTQPRHLQGWDWKRQQPCKRSQRAARITGWLARVLPEEYRADLESLRYRLLAREKRPQWVVRLITAKCLLEMALAMGRINLITTYSKSSKTLVDTIQIGMERGPLWVLSSLLRLFLKVQFSQRFGTLVYILAIVLSIIFASASYFLGSMQQPLMIGYPAGIPGTTR